MKSDKLINHLRAGFSLYWLKTHEPNRVRSNIYKEIQEFKRKDGINYEIKEWVCSSNTNPQDSINSLLAADSKNCTILFLYNLHWFLKPMIIQAIQDAQPILSSKGSAIVVVSPKTEIPLELEKDMVLMEMDLPDEEEIQKTISFIAPETLETPKDPKELQRIINSCRSLTATELKQVLALSLIETEGKKFSIEVINDYRAQAIQKTGFLDVIPGNMSFEDIVGYDSFKTFVLETIDNPEAKGVIAIGPPGCGKTSILKAIVGETGKFGLEVNMGKLFSKYQGETDANINTTIDIICALGNVFVLIDEFEKQFAGANSDGTTDSGTTRRATGRWLDFLQNRPEGVYVCATANSFRGIGPEYLRPGRWDTSPFLIDLPTHKTRMAILKYYMKAKGLKGKTSGLDGFTGAEIEALCHIAKMRGISMHEAEKSIIPQIKTMGDEIQAMRDWAKDRCISAEEIIESKNNDKVNLDI